MGFALADVSVLCLLEAEVAFFSNTRGRERQACRLIAVLAQAASIVLFSAAIPEQGSRSTSMSDGRGAGAAYLMRVDIKCSNRSVGGFARKSESRRGTDRISSCSRARLGRKVIRCYSGTPGDVGGLDDDWAR
jgi:hypothetical protein